MKIHKNDNVQVLAGKDKGKTGKVRQVNPKNGRVMVEGVNMTKRHARATKQARQAGIIEREAPICVSNVMLVCNKCNKGTRIGYKALDDGKKVRICKKCGEVMD